MRGRYALRTAAGIQIRTPSLPNPGPAFLTDESRGCSKTNLDDQGLSAELFYGTSKRERSEAKRICRGCPFLRECDEYATRRHEHWGVWAGKCRDPRQAPMSHVQVRELFEAGMDDEEIAFRVGRSTNRVALSRARQELYRPGESACSYGD